MNKEKELAKHLKDRTVLIGTSFKHMETIAKYAKENQQFNYAFALPYISLQNYVFIELFKLFDKSGEDTKQNNVYALVKLIDDDNKTISKELSKFNKTIEYITQQRNHYYAHDTGENVLEIYNEEKIKPINELLEFLVKICRKANSDLLPNTYVSNVRDFDDWCSMANDAIKEVCSLNGQIFNHGISKEDFLRSINDYIVFLKDKQEKKI